MVVDIGHTAAHTCRGHSIWHWTHETNTSGWLARHEGRNWHHILANLTLCRIVLMLVVCCCRQWSSTLLMRPCAQIVAYAGFASVMGRRPWRMLKLAGWCDLAGPRAATVKELLWCYWRWDEMFFLDELCVLFVWENRFDVRTQVVLFSVATESYLM